MTKELWINLPVKDLDKSKAFFTQIGFSLTPEYTRGNEMAGLAIGDKKFIVMLFPESSFHKYTAHTITDTRQSTEALFSFDAGSREEVDEMARKVAKAGGTIFAKPGEEQGWMYGFGFADPDGHRWNMLYMDMSKMPKA